MAEIEPITRQLDRSAVEIVQQHPEGIANREVISALVEKYPHANLNTIGTRVADLHHNQPDAVSKPARGILAPTDSQGETPETDGTLGRQGQNSERTSAFNEESFYSPFAEWLESESYDVSVALPLGGAPVKSKWANPDVIGTYRPQPADPYKFAPELLVAEIKIDPSQSVVAFGQAIAYRLFAHRVYIVMPRTIAKADQSRLESLSHQHGIGLVYFELDPENPNFIAAARPQASQPDLFYLNEFLFELQRRDRSAFNALF